jgi:hypothetical protein
VQYRGRLTLCVADNQLAEAMQPGEASLDLPASPVSSQQTSNIGLRLRAVAPLRRNYSRAELGKDELI